MNALEIKKCGECTDIQVLLNLNEIENKTPYERNYIKEEMFIKCETLGLNKESFL